MLGAVVNRPLTTNEALEANFTNEGAADGSSIRFLRNIMGTWMLQCLKRESGLSFDELEEMAKRSSFPALVDPASSEFLSPISMKEAIDTALEKKGHKRCKDDGEYAAVIYNSLAAAYRDAAFLISKLTGKTYDHIAIVGGGCKDDYLCSLTASYTNMDVTAGPSEGTAVGNLLSQMLSTGELSIDEKNDTIKRSFELVKYQRS